MKTKELVVFIKGKGLRTIERKDFLKFLDEDVFDGDTIEIVEVHY